MRKTRKMRMKSHKRIMNQKKRTRKTLRGRQSRHLKNTKNTKNTKPRRMNKRTIRRGSRRMHRGMRRGVHRGMRHHRMRGGMADIKSQNTILGKNIPYLPPGGPYKVGSDMNGLDGGYYYGYNKNPYLPDPHPYWQGYGGGLMDLVPQDLRNLGRNISTTVQNFGRTWKGEPHVQSPSVMKQPIGEYEANIENTSDIPKIYKENVKLASQ